MDGLGLTTHNAVHHQRREGLQINLTGRRGNSWCTVTTQHCIYTLPRASVASRLLSLGGHHDFMLASYIHVLDSRREYETCFRCKAPEPSPFQDASARKCTCWWMKFTQKKAYFCSHDRLSMWKLRELDRHSCAHILVTLYTPTERGGEIKSLYVHTHTRFG